MLHLCDLHSEEETVVDVLQTLFCKDVAGMIMEYVSGQPRTDRKYQKRQARLLKWRAAKSLHDDAQWVMDRGPVVAGEIHERELFEERQKQIDEISRIQDIIDSGRKPIFRLVRRFTLGFLSMAGVATTKEEFLLLLDFMEGGPPRYRGVCQEIIVWDRIVYADHSVTNLEIEGALKEIEEQTMRRI